ncbi:TIP49 C-terminus-domain-containing protein [Pisolithus marmoratus]|nr:TIP49 C-terminus-domain-containing protein [Pisolithus marmoratus]
MANIGAVKLESETYIGHDSRTRYGQNIVNVMGNPMKNSPKEVMEKLRKEVNKAVKVHVDQSAVETLPGVCSSVHMLDIECFTLDTLLEALMAPTITLVTNRGNSVVRGTTDGCLAT